MIATLAATLGVAHAHRSELLSDAQVEALGFEVGGNATFPSSHDTLPDVGDDYPSDFTWCNYRGHNYCSESLNQHLPQYCGSCWAHGSISALQDRIKIARGPNVTGADVKLSVQHVLNCRGGGSCHGGSVGGPYQWLHRLSKSGTGISYFTSQPYMACSHESGEGFCDKGPENWSCSAEDVARTCTWEGTCAPLLRYPNATISDHGSLGIPIGSHMRSAMMKEIFNRGPIACGIDAASILDYTGGIVTGFSLMDDHVISVVGWGTDVKEGLYWIVRNSWGEYWGENGYIRVKSGAKALERSCAWAVPGEFTAPEHGNGMHCFEDGSNCQSGAETPRQPREARKPRKTELLPSTARSLGARRSSHEDLKDPDGGFPEEFSWCNKDGINYCTSSLNQHIPQYCGSCWAHAAASALQDRIKIARGGMGPDITLSVQHLLNCGGAGDCVEGGDEFLAYKWMKEIGDATGSGIAYLSGQPYMACSSNSTLGICPYADWSCTALNTARTCATFGEECVGLTRYPNATISEYGEINGTEAMQREIFNRGPIACDIDSGPLEEYTTGVATDAGEEVDHVVSIVGWGQDDTAGSYWLVRNSWGEYWGEHGYARVKFGAMKLGDYCAWAVPLDFTAPERHNQYACFEDGSNCKAATELFA